MGGGKVNEDIEDVADEELEVFSFSGDEGEFYCGFTVVTDRWMIAAAHCFDRLELGSVRIKMMMMMMMIIR